MTYHKIYSDISPYILKTWYHSQLHVIAAFSFSHMTHFYRSKTQHVLHFDWTHCWVRSIKCSTWLDKTCIDYLQQRYSTLFKTPFSYTNTTSTPYNHNLEKKKKTANLFLKTSEEDSDKKPSCIHRHTLHCCQIRSSAVTFIVIRSRHEAVYPSLGKHFSTRFTCSSRSQELRHLGPVISVEIKHSCACISREKICCGEDKHTGRELFWHESTVMNWPGEYLWNSMHVEQMWT